MAVAPGPAGTIAPLRASDDELVDAIIQAGRAMVAIAAQSLEAAGSEVTLSQYRTLVVLADHGPRRLADLAASLGVSPSTATRMCDRLVRKGLIERTRDDLDRREVKLVLNPSGQRVVGGVIERRRQLVCELLGEIPETARPALVDALRVLSDVAAQVPEPHWTSGWSD